jgi:hypothetical protein
VARGGDGVRDAARIRELEREPREARQEADFLRKRLPTPLDAVYQAAGGNPRYLRILSAGGDPHSDAAHAIVANWPIWTLPRSRRLDLGHDPRRRSAIPNDVKDLIPWSA